MKWIEHYREAERLLGRVDATQAEAERTGANGETFRAALEILFSMAQVHATLAQTAVLAAQGLPGHDGPESVVANTPEWGEEL